MNRIRGKLALIVLPLWGTSPTYHTSKTMEKILSKLEVIAEKIGVKVASVDNVKLGGTAVGLTAYAVVVTLILFL